MQKKIIVGTIFLGIVAVISSVYFYRQYQKAQYRLNHPTDVAQQDAKETLRAVGKLMMLPEGEEPTVMQVTDIAKLKDQPFFANAKNGDKVVIYTKAKKAILYRVDINKIIDIAPINIGSVATPSAVGKTPYTFTILNATTTKGLAQAYEITLVSKEPQAKVVALGNSRGDFKTSRLVDVSGMHKDEADALAKTLGIAVSSFPAGEATPSSDFLIILAGDQK